MMKYEKGQLRRWKRRKIFVHPWHKDKRLHQPQTTVRMNAGWTELVVHRSIKMKKVDHASSKLPNTATNQGNAITVDGATRYIPVQLPFHQGPHKISHSINLRNPSTTTATS